MKNYYHQFEVNSSIDHVWKFYTNIRHLEIVSPKDIKLSIIQTTDEILIQGTKIVISTKWYSKITSFEKYQYVDEMIQNENKKAPFQIWKHKHIFKEIGDCKTSVIDKIEFGLPYGFIGNILELFILFKLQKIFEYRKLATKKFLENNL
jgi:ligand-binding SRPBCC domain-containing protein